MRKSSSLRTRLALFIAVLVVSLSWLFGAFISHNLSERLREEAGGDLVGLAYQMGDRLDRDMAKRSSFLQVISQLDLLRRPGDPAFYSQQVRILDQLDDRLAAAAWIGLLDAEGVVQVGSDRVLEGVDISHRPVYVEGSRALFVGDVHEALMLEKLLPNPSGEPMKFVDISWPIRDASGRLLGVLATHLSWAWAEEVSQSLLRADTRRQQVEFFVIAANGTVLLGPEGWVGRQAGEFLWLPNNSGEASWSVVEWPVEQGTAPYLTGVALADGHGDYSGLDWVIAARQPLAIADQPAEEMRLIILVSGVVIALIFAVAGWYFVSYLISPLRQIATAADRLSTGEDVRIPVIRGVREIEVLGESIRNLVHALSRQEQRLDEMSELAHTDALTGLANRTALERYLQSHDPNEPLALLFLDLDGFKRVNDDLGHAAGDELLMVIAQRLQSKVRENDLLVRLGGDEFVIVLAAGSGVIGRIARQLAERTLKAVSVPVKLAAGQAQVHCSIGGAFWPDDGATTDEVLECADKALYQAKARGKNTVVFSSEL